MPDHHDTWLCGVCGFEYHEAEGWPDSDIPPGTAWDDVPEGWRCPQCAAKKSKFELADPD